MAGSWVGWHWAWFTLDAARVVVVRDAASLGGLGSGHGCGRYRGADTLKRCVVLSPRAVASPHWVSIGLLLCRPNRSQSGWGNATAAPMYTQYDGAARRWLLRRWECVPSLELHFGFKSAGAWEDSVGVMDYQFCFAKLCEAL